MTRRRDVSAATRTRRWSLLAESVAPVCTIVGKTWTLHLEKLVKVDRAENLRMIAESVAFLRGEGKRVIYDAEHFFDGWRAEPRVRIACVTRRSRGRRRDGDAVRHERLLAALAGCGGDERGARGAR